MAIASEAERCELDNAASAQLPSLAEADGTDAELYLDDMLLCLPLIGVGFFEQPGDQAETAVSLFLSGPASRLSRGPVPAALTALIGSQISRNSNTDTRATRADAAPRLLSYCTHRSLIGIQTTPPQDCSPPPHP